ncbi:hypothetical protein FJZ31_16110 [Candidatus Poribacteria bacterium]|nr:hypothetical protein [Candidatus Poribacteria bacterium]
MKANEKVTLQMDGSYPNICSGAISFKNIRTSTEITIQIPKELKAYGISNIVIDSGASSTIFPEEFAEKIDVRKPTEGEERYYIFSGVGGTCIGYISLDLIMIRIQNGEGRVENAIHPFFLTQFAPSITNEGKLLSLAQPYRKKETDFLCPLLEYRDDYTVEVYSPYEEFPPLRRRLKLEVDTGQEMDYILIGRDWQEEFEVIFKSEKIIIRRKEME